MSSVDSERIRIIETVFGLQPFIRYQGGKSRIANKIVKMMPPHHTYVEPMVGGGSVFFAKDPAAREIISDMDKSLMNFYRELKKEKLKRCDMTPNRNRFFRIRDKRKSGKNLGACDYLYLNKISFGGKGTSIDPGAFKKCKGSKARSCGIASKNQPKYAERLKKTKLETADFVRQIQKYDSKNTLFYLDPPYAGTSVEGYVHRTLQPEDVKTAVDKIKGKFILSYNNNSRIKKLFCKNNGGKYKCSTIKTSYTLNNKGKHMKKKELLIRNF